MKKVKGWGWIIISIGVLAVVSVATILVSGHGYTTEKDKGNVTEGTKFRIVNGNNNKPYANHEITICDGSSKPDPEPDPYCDGKIHPIIAQTKTDSSGIFYLDLSKVSNPSIANRIMIESSKGSFLKQISKNDSVTSTYSANHVRVINSDKNGKVISNKIYDLEKGEMEEILVGSKVGQTSSYDVIDLKVYE